MAGKYINDFRLAESSDYKVFVRLQAFWLTIIQQKVITTIFIHGTNQDKLRWDMIRYDKLYLSELALVESGCEIQVDHLVTCGLFVCEFVYLQFQIDHFSVMYLQSFSVFLNVNSLCASLIFWSFYIAYNEVHL